MRRSQCRMYVRDYEAVADLPWSTDLALTPDEAASLETTSCSHWEYDTSTFHSTVASEVSIQEQRISLMWGAVLQIGVLCHTLNSILYAPVSIRK